MDSQLLFQAFLYIAAAALAAPSEIGRIFIATV